MPPKRKRGKGGKANKAGKAGKGNMTTQSVPFGVNTNIKMSKIKPPQQGTEHIYYQPTQRNMGELKKYVFESEVCGEAWDMFQMQYRKKEMRALRKTIAYSTSLAIVSGRYFCWNRETEQILKVKLNQDRIKRSVSNTRFISNEASLIRNLSAAGNATTSISVVSCDTLDMVEVLSNNPEKGKIGVLNFASAGNPGGGWERGSGAQEECLCRRSTLICTLSDPWGWSNRSWSYPIPDFGAVYSPDVCIFRKSFRSGFAFYENPIHADFISVACFRNPPIKDTAHGIRINSGKILNLMLQKVRRIFEVAIANNIDTLVLGAWGCGVYANPPAHVALLFKQVIGECDGRIKDVYFAIPGDLDMYGAHNPNGNLTPFAKCFKTDVLQLSDFEEIAEN